jgi:hypothetical protein
MIDCKFKKKILTFSWLICEYWSVRFNKLYSYMYVTEAHTNKFEYNSIYAADCSKAAPLCVPQMYVFVVLYCFGDTFVCVPCCIHAYD